MRPFLLLTCLYWFSITNVFGQQGDLFITNFTPGANADPSASFDLVQRPDGLVTIANRSGLLLYDGQDWEIHSSSGTPTSLFAAEDGIYAGGAFGVGFQPYNHPESFKKLHADSLIRNILQLQKIDNQLIAIDPKGVHVFSTEKKDYSFSISVNTGYIKEILVVGNKPLVLTSSGNFWLNDQSLEYAEQIPPIDLAFSVNYDGYDIIGTTNGKLYKVTGSDWQELIINAHGFEESLSDIEFIDAVRVNGSLAVNTLNAGVIIFDISKLKIDRIINYHNGLPDSQTHFIASDSDGGIWVGHELGLSRIATNLPFEAFHNIPGLEGNLLNVVQYNNTLYVGTSTGLYYLEEVKDFNEIIKYVSNPTTPSQSNKLEEKKQNGFLSFLRRRKAEDKQKDAAKEPAVSYERQVTRELKSLRYVYKKIPDIDGKVVQQVVRNDEMFIGSLKGLFRLQNNKVEELATDPVKLVWVNKKNDFLIANTYNGEILSFSRNVEGKWINSGYFEGYQDNVMDIYEDLTGRVWFSSADEIYFITYDEHNIYAGMEFLYDNFYLDPVYISENASDQVTFNNRYGQWVYDEQNKKLISEPVNSKNRSFVKGANNSLWFNESGQWHSFSMPVDNKWLNVFDDAIYLSSDKEEGHIYLITGSNQLYKIPTGAESPGKIHHQNILLKRVSENGNKFISDSRFRISEKQNDLVFKFVQPDYSGLMDINYKYRIQGLLEEWTEWSPQNNRISLNYMPEGRYTLELVSKTALGQEFSSTPILIEVVPPYWKRPWFYAFEFTLLGMLLVVTIYLNRNSSRYRLLNKLLAFLTLIIIIEFIQVTAESYFETDISPIIGFAIQVTIALIVLPVEGFLRRLIIKNKKLKLPLYLRLRR